MEHATPSPLCSALVALLLATGLATRPQRGYAADIGAPAASSVGIEFLDGRGSANESRDRSLPGMTWVQNLTGPIRYSRRYATPEVK